MSKNHPHDNIYSILGKLEALKPTPEEKRFALVKEIRESVEAQGSILEGVSAIEAKLARQFAESKLDELSPNALNNYYNAADRDAEDGFAVGGLVRCLLRHFEHLHLDDGRKQISDGKLPLVC